MDPILKIIFGIEGLIAAVVLVLIVHLIVRKMNNEKKETFEKRDF